MYCGPLLININPGPGRSDDYLNLQSWLQQNSQLPEDKWKPHLYSYIHYVYRNMIMENKSQAVTMMGQIGSGKTFNLIHSIEYLCQISSFQNKNEEIFELIHKSIQMIHIISSIFRQNNMESTSSGILLKLGFNEDHKITHFDLDAKILDCTLPFSENGRSFSILHSLITGANKDIKKFLELPERENNLNFFKKFYNSFDYQTKQKFKLNDFEIWTKFHSLMNYFGFAKTEISELLQILSFILLCNEASIGKKKDLRKDKEEYCINKGVSSRKLAKTLNIPEDEFLKKVGLSRDLSEVKNVLISMMKSAYEMFFEFIKVKVKNYSKTYFENLTGVNINKSDGFTNYQSFNSNENSNNNLKFIYFMDMPGEVEDQTLGGLTTNLANESLQLFAGSQYLSIVDKLCEERLDLKFFQPLHSHYVVKSLIGKSGILKFLSLPFTEENFHLLNKKSNEKLYFTKTTQFFEDSSSSQSKIMFNFKFSHLNINYNYESLYLETKSLKVTPRIYKVFEASNNSVIQSVYNNVLQLNRSFYHTTLLNMTELFKPLEGLSPFIIYCLHSNLSYKIFFDDQFVDIKENWVLPHNLTIDILRNSLTLPILFWEWFGYHEWIGIRSFVEEFLEDFEKIKVNFIKYRERNFSIEKETLLSNLNPYETANYILSMLGFEKSYIFGVNHILFKKGTLKSIRNLLDKMISNMYNKYTYSNFYASDFYKKNSIQSLNKKKTLTTNDSKLSKPSNNPSVNNSVRSNSQIKNKSVKANNTKVGIGQYIPYKKPKISQDLLTGTSRKNNAKPAAKINLEKPISEIINENEMTLIKAVVQRVSFCNPERRGTMKIQCHLNLLENLPTKENNEVKTIVSMPNLPNFQKNIYSIYRYLSESGYGSDININEESSDEESFTPNYNNKEDNLKIFKKEHNILIPKTKQFDLIRSLLDYSQPKDYKIFDYSEVIPQIVTIQTFFRAMKSRKKYKIFRYIVKKLIRVQAQIKGMLIRKKFQKFLYCYNCIVFIQRFYKMRLKTRKREVPVLIRRNSASNSVKDEKLSKRVKKNHSEIVEDLDEEKYSEIFSNEKMRGFNTNDNFKIKTWDYESEIEKEKILEKLLLDNTLYNKSIENISKTLLEKSGITDNLKKSISQMKFNIKKNPRILGRKVSTYPFILN